MDSSPACWGWVAGGGSVRERRGDEEGEEETGDRDGGNEGEPETDGQTGRKKVKRIGHRETDACERACARRKDIK